MIKKPVVIIALKITEAIDWARHKFLMREIDLAKRRMVDFNGQVYIIVTKSEDLDGLEILEYINAPGATLNTHYKEIIETAKRRMI